MIPTHFLRTWNGTTIYGVRLRKDCYQVGVGSIYVDAEGTARAQYYELPQITSEVPDHHWTALPVETEGAAV